MKIQFSHEIYRSIILDTEQLKPVSALFKNELHEKHINEMYLGDTVFFSHSNCMWSDSFQEYSDITFINLNRAVIEHEFEKLKAKYGEVYDELRETMVVETDLDFTQWYQENLAYKNKR